MNIGTTWNVLLLLVVVSFAAYAGDGVIEINQAKVLAGAVTAGDAEGFPATISEPGSYRLTGNLTVPDENTNGIEIDVPNVSIDLNGFSILGPTLCTGSPIVDSCSPAGSGIGIKASGIRGFSVANGMISGMGDIGISAVNGDGRIEGVYAENSGRSGIVMTDGVITRCVSRRNGGTGFEGGSSVISENTARNNKGAGISTAGGRVLDNIASTNGGDGTFGQGSGVVSGNVCRFNEGYGLELLTTSIGYLNNSLIQNTTGTVSGGTSLGNNVCDGNTTCP